MEHLLPEYDVSSSHDVLIHASPTRVFDSLLDLDMGTSPIIRGLFALRGLPRAGGLADLERFGFRTLYERPPHALGLGLIGRFWSARGSIRRFEPSDFVSFSEPGFAKCTWTFQLVPASNESTRLETQTRVLCLDPLSRRRFKRYWTIVRPFSGWVRTEVLRIVKKDAETTAVQRDAA